MRLNGLYNSALPRACTPDNLTLMRSTLIIEAVVDESGDTNDSLTGLKASNIKSE